MRKRHDNKRDKDRLKNLHYVSSNPITKFLLSEEHPNDVPEETYKNKLTGFYINYNINLPINCIQELLIKELEND